MGANESVQSPERKASETRARTVPANSVGVGTHVKGMRTNTESEDLEAEINRCQDPVIVK